MSRIADWPRLFGQIITGTGWTKREIDALTLFEANELLEYWSEHPPTYVLLAAMMKARPLRKKTAGDLLSAVEGAGGHVCTSPPEAIRKFLTRVPGMPGSERAGGAQGESPA